MSTPCGDAITYGTWITETNSSYQPISYGFGGVGAPDAQPLLARWSVAGVPVVDNNGSIEAPTTDGVFSISYQLDPVTAELLLWSRGGERYRVDVTVAMSEADGSGTTFATAVFNPKGYYDGFGPGDAGKLARCMFKYAKSARLRLRDYLIPPGPGPVEREWANRINQRRMQQVIAQIADAHPGPASALAALTALRYGVANRLGLCAKICLSLQRNPRRKQMTTAFDGPRSFSAPLRIKCGAAVAALPALLLAGNVWATTIDFESEPVGTPITNQYQALGVVFSSPANPGQPVINTFSGNSTTGQVLADFSSIGGIEIGASFLAPITAVSAIAYANPSFW